MVVYSQASSHALDLVFGALSDGTRRDILARVMDAEAMVSELASRYDMSFAAVQKHVAVLERAHLVRKRKDGRAQWVSGHPEAIARASRLLTQFETQWHARVARLDTLLTDSPEGAPHARRRDSQGPRHAHDDRGRAVRRARRPRVGRVR